MQTGMRKMVSQLMVPLVLAAVLAVAAPPDADAQHPQVRHGHGHGPVSHTPQEEAALLNDLREGGHVIFFRHERTDALRLDDADMRLEDCATQRNLSLAGIASARQTGEYMEYLQVPVGDVLSSPLCRCLETARHAFGRARSEPRLRAILTRDSIVQERQARDLLTVVSESFQDETNTILIGHFGSSDIFGVRLLEGDALILRRGRNGEPEPAGVIRVNRWGDFLLDPVFRR